MKIVKVIQFAVVTVLIFSLWVAFALLLINPYLHPYIPGYQVGRPCGWEYVALAFSVFTSHRWTRNWPVPEKVDKDGISTLTLPVSLVKFLLAYLILAIAVFAFQYIEFSRQFG